MTNIPFKPITSYPLEATTTPQDLETRCDTNCYRLHNASDAVAFIKPSYMSTYFTLPAGVLEVLSFNQNETFSIYLASGTGNVYVTTGEGQ
jgi:hypothetical protein